MKSFVARFAGIVVAAVLFTLSSAGVATAQSKCDAAKLKEYGKKVFCLAKVDSKASKKGEAIDTAKETKCLDTFSTKCTKAEAQGDCTGAVKSCSELTTEADSCRAAATLAVTACDLVAQTGCGVGEGCYLVTGEAQCLSDGTVAVGGSCAGTSPNECVAGTQCFDTGGSVYQCLEFCSVSAPSCSGIATCNALSEPSFPDLGACL